jgi:uracil phosphoribosyltransferase
VEVIEISHPLCHAKLTELRDSTTSSVRFRQLAEELIYLLAYEATRNIEVTNKSVTTPVTTTVGVEIKKPVPLVLPILRAGLGLLDGMLKIMPQAEVGFLGAVRNEQTLEVTTYAQRLPENLASRHIFILDPMLATGGTLLRSIETVSKLKAGKITGICLLAAPEGIEHLRKNLPPDLDFTLVIAGIDEKLNEKGYIVPGLGDAGDRLFGSAK